MRVIEKLISALLLAVVFALLAGCDKPEPLKEASVDFDPDKNLQLDDFINAADSMAFFNCESNEPIFSSRLKKDFDELTAALTYWEKRECGHFYFVKESPSYYLELYRKGEPIDSTNILAASEEKGYKKTERLSKRKFMYYIGDSLKLNAFFESRHIPRLSVGCDASKRWPKGDCGLSCRPVETSDIQIMDSKGNVVSDSSVLALIDEIKKEIQIRYARYIADSNKHFDMDVLMAIQIFNGYITHFLFASAPQIVKISDIVKEYKRTWTCPSCGKGIRFVRIKLSLKDKSSQEREIFSHPDSIIWVDDTLEKMMAEPFDSQTLPHRIALADSMAVISCYPETPIPFKDGSGSHKKSIVNHKLTPYVIYSSSNRKDFDELAEATAYNTMEPCDGICFDKQWSAYYVELFKNGELIDNTYFYTVANTGYNKSGFNYYFANVEKVHDFFNSRNVFPMPRGCFAGENRHPRFKREKSEK